VFGRQLAREHSAYHLPKAKKDCSDMWWLLMSGVKDEVPKNVTALWIKGCIDGYKSEWGK